MASIQPEETVYSGPKSAPPRRVTLKTLRQMYAKNEPISMVTAYDYPSAVHVRNCSFQPMPMALLISILSPILLWQPIILPQSASSCNSRTSVTSKMPVQQPAVSAELYGTQRALVSCEIGGFVTVCPVSKANRPLRRWTVRA